MDVARRMLRMGLMLIGLIATANAAAQVQWAPPRSMYVNTRSVEIARLLNERYKLHQSVVTNAYNMVIQLDYADLNSHEKATYNRIVEVVNYCVERGDYENLGNQCIELHTLMDSLYPDCGDLASDLKRYGQLRHSLFGNSSFVKGIYCYKYRGSWFVLVQFKYGVSGTLGSIGQSHTSEYIYCGFSDFYIGKMVETLGNTKDLSEVFNFFVRSDHDCRCK